MEKDLLSKDKNITEGRKIAMSFFPFVSPGVNSIKDAEEVIAQLEKSIDDVILSKNSIILLRVSQLLSSLDYEKLTDFQSKCVLLLELELKK